MRKIIFSGLTALCLFIGLNSYSQVFISFDGIEGETTGKDLKDGIEIMSFSWGASNTSSFASGAGLSTGKVKVSEFTFTKSRGKSSLPIQMSVFTGKHIPKAEIRFYKAGSDLTKPSHYLSIILEDVVISNWEFSGSGRETPVESIAINFVRVKIEETIGTNPDGSPKKIIKGWDIAKNVGL